MWAGEQRLVLQKEGAGRLYYRVGLSYAPTNLKLAAADYGFQRRKMGKQTRMTKKEVRGVHPRATPMQSAPARPPSM